MKPIFVTTVASLWSAFAAASPTSEPVRAEIDALLAKLQASGCEFNRNGSWSNGSEARITYFESSSTLKARATS
jgi:hypothetical protein